MIFIPSIHISPTPFPTLSPSPREPSEGFLGIPHPLNCKKTGSFFYILPSNS